MNFSDLRHRICAIYRGGSCARGEPAPLTEDVDRIVEDQQFTHEWLTKLNSASAKRTTDLLNEVLDR